MRALTRLRTDIFDNKKGHNSHKNYPLAPNFELVQGLRNSNIQYEFDQNPLRFVGVRALTRFRTDGRTHTHTDGRTDTGISMSPLRVAAGDNKILKLTEQRYLLNWFWFLKWKIYNTVVSWLPIFVDYRNVSVRWFLNSKFAAYKATINFLFFGNKFRSSMPSTKTMKIYTPQKIMKHSTQRQNSLCC